MKTGYEIRYEEFLWLLTDTDNYGTEFIEDVEDWFDCKLQVTNSETPAFLTKNGRSLTAMEVFAMIQGDQQKQYFLYQAAMSHWR